MSQPVQETSTEITLGFRGVQLLTDAITWYLGENENDRTLVDRYLPVLQKLDRSGEKGRFTAADAALIGTAADTYLDDLAQMALHDPTSNTAAKIELLRPLREALRHI